MHRFTAILLAIVFLFHAISGLMPFISYQLNKSYITQKLCENRTKPAKHCNGHCHLVKEIKKEKEREKLPGNNLSEKHELLLFSDNYNLHIQPVFFRTIDQTFCYRASLCHVSLGSVFQPPCC